MVELNQLDTELNRNKALKAAPSTAIAEILQKYAKVRLNEWASLFQVTGRSKMNKQQLVDALVEQMTNTEVLSETLNLLTDNESKSLERLADRGLLVADNEATFGNLNLLEQWGIIHYFYNEETLSIVFPQEIYDVWKTMNRRPVQVDKRQYMIIQRYIEAMAHLYGAFKLEQLVDIYNTQQAEQITVAEVEHVLTQSLDKALEYGCIGEYVVHNYFVLQYEDDDVSPSNTLQLADMLMQRQSKPWYIPPANELLKYSNGFYYEITPQLSALHEYLNMYLIENEIELENLMDELQYYCRIEQSMSQLMSVFDGYDVIFETHEQVQLVVALVNEVYNHTRVWTNAGHTPYEMFMQYEQPMAGGQVESTFVPSFRAAPQVKKQKIGRNDPCPCNSGKKYKKCCGA